MTTTTPKKRVVMPWMRKRKRRLLPERELQVVKRVEEEQAEQVAAKQEAEAEAEKIISQARQEAEEIKKSAEAVAKKEAEAEAEKIISQARQQVQNIKRKAKVAAKKEAEAEAEKIISQARQEAEEIKKSAEAVAKKEAEAEAEKIISQARQEVEEIKKSAEAVAKKEAEAEAEKIISQAKQEAEEIKKEAEAASQQEAEAEAEKIVSQARQEAEEIKKGAEAVVQKEAGDIISAAGGEGGITEIEAKQKALLFLLKAREEIEKEVRGKYEAALLSTSGATAPSLETPAPTESETKPDIVSKEKIEEPAQPQEKATVSEPVETAAAEHLEQRPPKKRPGREETVPDLLKQDGQTLYAGEVDLAIAGPVDPKLASKLYSYLQTTPEIKLVRTSGSWERGTTITVVLDKPISLISVISSKIPEAVVTPERPEKNGFMKGKKGVRRINLALKEA